MGMLDILQTLLRHGAVTSEKNKSGWTPLSVAVAGGHEACSLALLNAGACVHSADYDGRTAIYWAARSEMTQVMKRLLELSANPNVFTHHGWSPLLVGVEHRKEAQVLLLLEAGADVNVQNANGSSPLHKAALRGMVEVMNACLLRKANPSARDAWDLTPADACRQCWHEDPEEYAYISDACKSSILQALDAACARDKRWQTIRVPIMLRKRARSGDAIMTAKGNRRASRVKVAKMAKAMKWLVGCEEEGLFMHIVSFL
ncbi:unnamed protein product [Chrysoparadoxa australica]